MSNDIANKLRKTIPYKWKIQSVSKNKPKASCVAYIDARDAMDLLDDAIGIDSWKDSYHRDQTGVLICKLELKINDKWIAKEDVGTASQSEAEKGEYSDAFKRAAVKWGVGRFLYDLKIKWVDTNKTGPGAYPVHPNTTNRIWDLTEFINNKNSKPIVAISAISAIPATAKKATTVVNNNNSIENKTCSKCGAKMSLKAGKYEDFWGCSNYPECKNIEKHSAKINNQTTSTNEPPLFDDKDIPFNN